MLYRISFLLFFGFIIWVIFQANTGSHNALFELTSDIPGNDKIGHFFLYGCLSILLNLAMNKSVFWVGKINFLKGSCVVLGIAVLEEFSQFYYPTRTPDFMDLVSGYLGILIFELLLVKPPIKINQKN